MNTQDLINQLAEQAGVDAATVETLAKMCADRIDSWGVEVDSDNVTAAVVDANASYKRMANAVSTRMHDFAPVIAAKAAH